MNARDLATLLDNERIKDISFTEADEATILRALRLLAAAEANDGSTSGSKPTEPTRGSDGITN